MPRIEVVREGERHWVWRYVESDGFSLDSNEAFENEEAARVSARTAYPDVREVVVDARSELSNRPRYDRGPQALRLAVFAAGAAAGVLAWRLSRERK